MEISFTGLSTRPLPYSPSSTNGLYIRDRCGRFMVCEFSDNLKNRFFPLIFLKPCWPIYTFKISFFCQHLFNLLLGYIVKHHILGANRGFHFPLWVQKRPFLFNLGSRNLIWFFTQNPGFWFLLYFIYNSLSYPLPSLWFLLVLVKFSCSLDFSHFEDHPFD